MASPDTRRNPVLRIHSGWQFIRHRLNFLVHSVKYLVQRRQYPLFRILPFRSGILGTLAIARQVGLRRTVQHGDSIFPALIVPHFPSPAFDHMVARGGLNFAAAGTPHKQQIDTAILAITRTCALDCRHCYEKANIGAPDEVPITRWKEVIHDLQEQGVSVIVLSGGEPMLRFEGLLEILSSIDKNLSDVHLHTSGYGVTLERTVALKKAGLVAAAVGLDDVDPQRHDALRGCPGAHRTAIQALKDFNATGVFTYLNMCATPALVRSGDLWRYFDLARSLDVGFIQILEPRPCGAYLNQGNEVLLTDEDRAELLRFFTEANSSRRYRRHPVIRYLAHAESPDRMGCMMGGLSHFHIDSRGNVNPCVFLPVTFGNIREEEFPAIYRRMRSAVPRPVHTTCPSLQLGPALKEQWASGAGMPVPHQAIRSEWERVVSEPGRGRHGKSGGSP